jgi:hypothetical protein
VALPTEIVCGLTAEILGIWRCSEKDFPNTQFSQQFVKAVYDRHESR